MGASGGLVRTLAHGVSFHVRLTPKGCGDRIDGWSRNESGATLRVRVSAPPEKGKANAALIALLAEDLGIAKSRIAIAAGDRGRLKTIAIKGDAVEIARKLEALGDAS